MTPSPDPPSPVGVRKRRRKKHERFSIPVIGWMVIAVCLLLVLTIAWIGSNGWHSRNGDTADAVAPVSSRSDFAISSATRDEACRCIRGELKNKSGKAFTEVQIYFELRGKNGLELGTVLAITGRIGPRGQTSFATDNMPPGTETYKLKEIIGIT